MSNFSDYAEVKVIDHILRSSSFSKPSAIYLALVTTLATDSSTGSTLVEPSGGGYARYSLGAPADATWTRSSSTTGVATNAASITFTASGGNYGTIVGIALVDSSSAGNVLFYSGTLTSGSKTINDGDSLVFAIGDISITVA